VEAGQSVTVTVPPLQADETGVVVPLAGGTVELERPGRSALSADERQSTQGAWTGKKTAALVFGATGMAGVAVAVLGGLKFERKKEAANDACPGTCSVPEKYAASLAYREQAKNARILVLVGGIAGAAGLIGGAAFWFTAGRPSNTAKLQIAPIVNSREVGLGMGGRW
jgi:hypothetical protein